MTRAAEPTKMARIITVEVPNVEWKTRRSGTGRSDTESTATGRGAVAAACARPLLLGSLRMTTRVVYVGREVDTRITIEKAARHQLEAGEDAGLNGKVFRPDLMVKPEHVPEDDVCVFDAPGSS